MSIDAAKAHELATQFAAEPLQANWMRNKTHGQARNWAWSIWRTAFVSFAVGQPLHKAIEGVRHANLHLTKTITEKRNG
jgi:hypothetical protein